MNKKTILCILLFAVLPLFFFWDGKIPPNLLENGDGLFYYLTERVTATRVIKDGMWPLWNPYRFGGSPLMADPETGCFYPPNILFLFLPPLTAFNWIMYLHYFLAGIFTFCYMRLLGARYLSGIVSGLIYMFSGFMITRLGHMDLQNMAAWVPAVFLSLEKVRQGKIHYAAIGACVFGLIILTGFFQGAVYLTIYILAYIIYFGIVFQKERFNKRLITGGVGMLFGGILLSMVQILPTIEFALQTNRRVLSYEFFSSFSFSPRLLPLLIFPNIFGGNSYRFYPVYYQGEWNLVEMTMYCGILPLCLACIGFLKFRKKDSNVLFWSFVAILSFCLALGGYNPFYKITYYLPFYNMFRCSARHWFMFDFSIAILAGLALNRLRNNCMAGKPKI